MDTEQVRRLLVNGQSPRQVAERLGYKRVEVEEFRRQMSAMKTDKMKKIGSLTAVFSVLIGAISYFAYQRFREPTDLEVHTNVIKLANAVVPLAGADPWFIENDTESKTTAGLETEIALIEKLTSQLNQAITVNSDVPEVAVVKDLFGGHLYPTIFQGGMTRHLTFGSADEISNPQTLEVAFFGRASFDHPIVAHQLLSYKASMSALMIGALQFPDEKWYGAMICHELWHAKLHREGAASATAPMLSDSWIEEELAAHHVEERILDARTNGEYGRRLDAIAGKNSARSIRRFILNLTPDDFHQLEELFKPPIPAESDFRAAQYLLDLGLRWAKNKFSGSELTKRGFEIYRFIIQPQSTNVQ